MAKLIDLTGQMFGRLTVIGRGQNKGVKPGWICVCECRKIKSFRGSDLTLGKVLSCGCLRNERVRSAIEKHGSARRGGKEPEYNVWLAMRARCKNPNNKDFHHYGGRGIAVCDWWDESYEHFIAEPSNCRWATWSEQRRNTREYIAKHGASQ